MKSLKNRFGSRKDKTEDVSSSAPKGNPLAQPLLAPGFYGQFPPSFSIYYAGVSKDKKSEFYLMNNIDGPVPLNAVTLHKGMVKHHVTLHSTPQFDSPPIALGGIAKVFTGPTIVAVPTSSATEAMNQIVTLKDHKKILAPLYSFSVNVGPEHRSETFEWRSNHVKEAKTNPGERRLVRMTSTQTGGEEVVGIYKAEARRQDESKMGAFQFQGTGLTGEMGPCWTLVAVITLLKLCQANWEAAVVADGALKASGMLLGAGLGLGIGAI